MAEGEFRKTLVVNGVEPAGGTPAELHAYIRADFHKWRKVIQQAQIRIE